MEKLYPVESTTALKTIDSAAQESSSTATAQDTLDKEIRELKQQSKKGRTGHFIPLDSVSEGYTIDRSIDHSNRYCRV